MNWFTKFLARFVWKPEQRVYVGQRQAGVNVTSDTALMYSAVHSCIRIISETIASLPWHVYQRLDSGRQEKPGDALYNLLNVAPNEEQTAFAFKRQLISHYLAWGAGRAEIETDSGNRPRALWPLLPDRTEVRRDEQGRLVYEIQTTNGPRTLTRSQVFDITDLSYDGMAPYPRVSLGARSIGAGIAQDLFTAACYANGANVGGVIEHPGGKLTPEARDTLLKEFNEKYAGPDRARKTLYLDGTMTYKQLPMLLSEAQFIETRHYHIEDVCRWFGVPQHLVQMLTETNYAISYTADKNFVEHTLRPICVLLEQEANVRLLRSRPRTYTKINLSALLRGDPKTRAEYYRSMINAGVYSINEVRELEEQNSIGPVGDEHYLQTNMTTIERIAEGENTQQQQPTQDPQQDMPSSDEPNNVSFIRARQELKRCRT